MIRRWLAAVAVAGAAASALAGAPTAVAQDAAESTYLDYHKAIHAAERCRRDHPFGSPEQSRMADYIDGRIDFAIATGRRLQLIEAAKRDVDTLVDGQGCSGDIAGFLAVFDAELAPLLAP
jgi:hypothetical protein